MINFEVFKLALVGLKANKVRSFLTMLGIIIGVSAVILLISLGSGLQNYITQQFESLGSNLIYIMPGQIGQEGQGFSQGPPNFAGSKLTLKDAKDLAKLGDLIVDASTAIEEPVSVKYGNISKYSTVHGVEDNFAKMVTIKIAVGRLLTRADMEQQRKVAVMGPAIKEKIFGDTDAIGKKILISDVRYDVVGISEKKGGSSSSFDDIIFIPLTTAQKQFNKENVQSIMVQVKAKNDIPEAKNILEKFFLKRYKKDEFSIVDQESLLQTINSIIGVLTAALGGIAAISLLVGGIGIMNIMLVSVTERTREIGLRKAVGARFRDILFQFLIEAITLCLAGGFVGILIGIGGSVIARKFIPAVVPLWSVILAFGFSAAVGIIFGVAPAYKAAKLDPINALRYE